MSMKTVQTTVLVLSWQLLFQIFCSTNIIVIMRPLLFMILLGAVATPTKSAYGQSEEIIDPEEEIKMFSTTPLPPEELGDWKDWETWEAPSKIKQLAPYYKAGYDKDGSPVYVLEYGKWNYRALAQLAEEELQAYARYYEQLLRRVSKDGAANNIQGIVLICDWDGFTLAHYASSDALKLALKSFTGIIRFNNALRYAFQINTNFAAETFVNLARPFLGNILEKFEIYGGRTEKWKPALGRKISADQLPPHYGGSTDWKPLPFN